MPEGADQEAIGPDGSVAFARSGPVARPGGRTPGTGRTPEPVSILLVAFGAGLGSVARFGVDTWLGPGWSALSLVNVAGSAVLGLLVGALATGARRRWASPLLGTGLLGGFTTFSAVTVRALIGPSDAPVGGLLLVVALTVACVVAAAGGWWAGHRIAGHRPRSSDAQTGRAGGRR